ncbi:MAG: hypothetical protein CMJ98_02915 [Planctomycetes bacterium]|nr:hypothetical protein [Planctomycetota bacterium]
MPPKKARHTISKKGHDAFPRLDDFKRCTSCQSLIEAKLTKHGLDGKKDDPIAFPHCEHAMHASCLVEWYLGTLGPRERALLERRGKKSVRQLALSEYDGLYDGRCEACTRDAPVRPASARNEACRRNR